MTDITDITDMTDLTDELSFAPGDEELINWADRVNPQNIKEYWLETVGKETLQDDETIRITAILPYEDEKGNLDVSQKTLKDQVRSADEFISLMKRKYAGIKKNEWKKLVGWSMSCATYGLNINDNDVLLAPGRDSFRTIETFVIDMDSHTKLSVDDKSSERFNFNSFDEESRRISVATALSRLNILFENEGMDLVLKASKAYATGGGLQFTFKFDKPLIKEDADRVLAYIKHAINSFKKQRFTTVGVDFAGNISYCYFDFDLSSTDLVHTQRVGGTINPKKNYFGAFAEEITDIYNEEKLEAAKNRIRSKIEFIDRDEVYKSKLRNNISLSVSKFQSIKNDEKFGFNIDTAEVIRLEKLLKHTNETYRKGDKETWSNAHDFDILQQIPVLQQAEYMGSFLELLKDQSTTRYSAYVCPVHEDASASFVIYHNPDKPISYAKDFHDDKVYNCITLMMELHKISHIDALHMVASDNDVQLKSSQRKTFAKELSEGDVEGYIDKVNTDEYIYYRLANKNRSCIVREFATGDSFNFDGTKMLTDHILLNQLNVAGASLTLRSEFHDMFVEKVLINAFESFIPGKPATFSEGFVKYVNLWIPGDDYLEVHERAKLIDQMDIPQAIAMIKDQLPTMYFYLCQMTQKGSLEYFVNWLINVSQFKTMSTIPIITTVQGTGKGVFIENVLHYYLNQKYVNTVSADKMANNFNSFMMQSALIVLDEGDFSSSKEIDNLKLLSGNNWIQVEKKGVDSENVQKRFNMIMMTNGETPARHPSNDRRFTYFRCDVSLTDSITHLGFEHIDDFIESVHTEVCDFWAILTKTNTKQEWSQHNLKDNQFNKQILLMHQFGILILKIIDGEWDEIKLQISENSSESMVIQNDLEMIDNIKHEFEQSGKIDLALINRYIKSMNFKSFISVQQFIKMNALHKNGITVETTSTNVKIVIDKKKLKALVKMSNNLGKLYPAYNDENIEKTLNDINSHDSVESDVEAAVILNAGLQPIDSSDPLGLQPMSPSSVIAPPPSSHII